MGILAKTIHTFLGKKRTQPNQTKSNPCLVQVRNVSPGFSTTLWHLVVSEKELVLVLAGRGSAPLSTSRKICPSVGQKALPAQLPAGDLLQGSSSEACGKPRVEEEDLQGGWEGLQGRTRGHQHLQG